MNQIVRSYFNQSKYGIKCEWGNAGLEQLLPVSDVVIIIDVLSFTTAVDIAASRGAVIYPYPYKDETAQEFARSKDALLAGEAGVPYRLSPATLLEIPSGTRLVLPSPNGAALSCLTGAAPTLAACLRNAAAVAEAAQAIGRRIGVIPAGERWPDGSLRPAIEDLAGAGAVIQALRGSRSPEAETAQAVFERYRDDLYSLLHDCSSGKELAGKGREADIGLAAKLNCSETVPRLQNSAYQGGR